MYVPLAEVWNSRRSLAFVSCTLTVALGTGAPEES